MKLLSLLLLLVASTSQWIASGNSSPSQGVLQFPVHKHHLLVETISDTRSRADQQNRHADGLVSLRLPKPKYWRNEEEEELGPSNDQRTLTSRESKDYDVELYGNTVEYYLDIYLGNPPQKFTVQVDTGSSLMAIPSYSCTTCSHANPLFDPSQSTTSRSVSCEDETECSSQICYQMDNQHSEVSDSSSYCSFNISYGDNSNINGYLVRDVIRIGDVASNNSLSTSVVFGTIAEERPQNGFQSRQVDGILGMAYGVKRMICLPNCVTPVMDVFVAENQLEDIFSLSLEPVAHGVESGAGILTLGGMHVPPGNSTNRTDIYYSPIKEETYYVVAVEDLLVGGQSIRAEQTHYGVTVVDSGTTFMILPKQIYDGMKNVFQSNYCHIGSYICGTNTIFNYGQCLNSTEFERIVDLFPNITISLENVKLTLRPRDYMEKMTSTSHQEFYCLGIVSGSSKSTLTILGDTFMRAFYVVFDRTNKRIGFSGAPDTVVPTSSKKSGFSVPKWIIATGVAIISVGLIIAAIMTIVWHRRRKAYEQYELLLPNRGGAQGDSVTYAAKKHSNSSNKKHTNKKAKDSLVDVL